MRRSDPMPSAVLIPLALIVAAASIFVLSGCKSLSDPNTETAGAVPSTGTVQADVPVDSTGTPTPTSTVAASATASTAPAAPKAWPAKVGTFAKNMKGIPVWYPTYLPKGYKVDSLDVIELDKGTGLVCDIAYVSGDLAITFTQGSPKERVYDVVSAGKVPWGTEKADLVHLDPTDPSTQVMIVYSHGGTFIELQGDASLDELKKVAASMVAVK